MAGMAAPFPQLPPLSGRRSALWAEYWQQRSILDTGHRQAAQKRTVNSAPPEICLQDSVPLVRKTGAKPKLRSSSCHQPRQSCRDGSQKAVSSSQSQTSLQKFRRTSAAGWFGAGGREGGSEASNRREGGSEASSAASQSPRPPHRFQVFAASTAPNFGRSLAPKAARQAEVPSLLAPQKLASEDSIEVQKKIRRVRSEPDSLATDDVVRRRLSSDRAPPLLPESRRYRDTSARSPDRAPPPLPISRLERSPDRAPPPLPESRKDRDTSGRSGNLEESVRTGKAPGLSTGRAPPVLSECRKGRDTRERSGNLDESIRTGEAPRLPTGGAQPPLSESKRGRDTHEGSGNLNESSRTRDAHGRRSSWAPGDSHDRRGHGVARHAQESDRKPKVIHQTRHVTEVVTSASVHPPEHIDVRPDFSSGSESSSDSEATIRSIDDEDVQTYTLKDPIEVELPQYYPELLSMPGRSDSFATSLCDTLTFGGRLPLEIPMVHCVGPGKLIVRWELLRTVPATATFFLRLRPAGSGDEHWQMIDMDSGRVGQSCGHEDSWKYHALVMQPGLKVLSFCVLEGAKSKTPCFGKVVAYYPGIVVVDFELTHAEHNRSPYLRQRVPQDWVVLAATSKTMGAVMWDLLDKQVHYAERSRGKNLWKVAKNKVFERIVRANRHCSILWGHWLKAPDLSCRIAVSCAIPEDQIRVDRSFTWGAGILLSAQRPGSEDGTAALSPSQDLKSKVSNHNNVYTWWPAALGDDSLLNRKLTLDDQPPAGVHANVEVVFEPWPRVQIVQKEWLCDCGDDTEFAKRNACIGQTVLAYYGTRVSHSWKHPPPSREGDVTLQLGDAHLPGIVARSQDFHGESQSERAVRGEIRRELVSPAEVLVTVLCTGKATSTRVSLADVYDVHPPRTKEKGKRKDLRKRRLSSWLILRNQQQERFDVFAQRQLKLDTIASTLSNSTLSSQTDNELETLKLEAGVRISYFSQSATASRRRLLKGKVCHVAARITHYEIIFEDVVPPSASVSTHSLASRIGDVGDGRIYNPGILVHGLPEDLEAVEVAVGWSKSPQDFSPVWSLPSDPCVMRARKSPLLAPLGPTLWAEGVARAEMRWFMPSQSPGLCFRVQLRTSGDAEWCLVDSDGQIREEESTFAWRSRLVPLVKGLWVCAFGDLDGRKSSTPGIARIDEVGSHGNTVNVHFETHSKELCLGAEMYSAVSCTQSPEVKDETQRIPCAWVESLYIQEGEHYFKGSPFPYCTPQQEAVFQALPDNAAQFSIQLEGDKEPVPNTCASGTWLHAAGVARLPSHKNAVNVSLQVGALQIQGLRAEVQYEVRVQALTQGGWTPWTEPAVLQMPRIGYVHEKLVHETKATALFYQSPLLPQAFYKEYQKCAETLASTLSSERFARLKDSLVWTESRYDIGLSRYLVDMEGPIRLNKSADEIRLILRDLADRRADLNYRDQSTGRTPLTYACEYGWCVKLCVIEELLDLQADVNSMNDSRQTALSIAAAGGHQDIVELLLRHGADVTVWNADGETALLNARVMPEMSSKDMLGVQMSRYLLKKNRIPWETFEKRVSEQSGVVDAAKAFLELAFPDGAPMFQEEKDGSKRISRHDRLRLREQIREAAEDNPEEAERRGRFCGHQLLLPQMRMATLQTEKNSECGKFTRYLLFSGAMRYCEQEAHAEARRLLDHYEQILMKKRDALKSLPKLTDEAEMFIGLAATNKKKRFLDRPLHQWHAHNDLLWLTERNVVGAFEALIHGGAVRDVGGFCTWVGELQAQISASDPNDDKRTQRGAWDDRLPPLFWGVVYSKFLLGEASRAAPIFHKIAKKLVSTVGGNVQYLEAPNKSYTRVSAKQIEYATFGLLALHVCLNLMPGCFQKAIRADLDDRPQLVKHVESTTGAVLILAGMPPLGTLEVAARAVGAVLYDSESKGEERPPILIYVRSFSSAEEEKEFETELISYGADAVVFQKGPLEVDWVKPALQKGLEKAWEVCRSRRVQGAGNDPAISEDLAEKLVADIPSADRAQLLFDIQKCRTFYKEDLLCAGGLLDLVRGSITCKTEDEVRRVFELAVTLTLNKDNAEVLRVKNGFHTPTVGGYSDLKCFMVVSDDRTKVCHICELQVHLKEFLDCKKYTHMPYVIDRGDFNKT